MQHNHSQKYNQYQPYLETTMNDPNKNIRDDPRFKCGDVVEKLIYEDLWDVIWMDVRVHSHLALNWNIMFKSVKRQLQNPKIKSTNINHVWDQL